MRYAILLLTVVCVSLLLFAPCHALPSREEMDKDLATIYRTKAATPDVSKLTRAGRDLEPLMFQQARFIISRMKPWEKNAAALSMTPSNHDEHSIRPNAHAAYALAVMYRSMPGPYIEGFDPLKCRETSLGALRFMLPTHGAGDLTCNNERKWHNQWQSALWAYSAGCAAWLLWDELDPEMRWLAARMICDEADRFIDATPPAQIVNDTKAEENAWNSTVIALAYSMFPHHPNREKYREAAIRWAVSSFLRKADIEANPTVEGRPLREWFEGANIHDDYTLENHNRVHPDYMNTFTLLLNQIPIYEWGGNVPPMEALTFNAPQIYENLKKFEFPDAGFLYPNGQDWSLHRNPDWMMTHLPVAILFNDAEASRIHQISLKTFRKMAARDRSVGVYLPNENTFPSTDTYVLESSIVLAYLHNGRGGDPPAPVAEKQFWKSMVGTQVFETGQFGIQRTARSVSTFSWGRQVMGMVVPLQEDLLLTPYERGLVGVAAVDGQKGEAPAVQEVKLSPVPGSLAAAGVLKRGGGLLEQRFAFVALPDDRTLYMDRVVFVGDSPATVTLSLGTIPVLNDERWVYHDGSRTVFSEGGRAVFAATDQAAIPQELPSRWFNIDDELGIVCLKRTGSSRYYNAPSRANGRVQQLFHLNEQSVMTLKNGDVAAETALLLLPGSSASGTARTSKQAGMSPAGALKYAVRLDKESMLLIDLNNLTIMRADHAE